MGKRGVCDMKIRLLAVVLCVALCAPLAAQATEQAAGEPMTMMGFDNLSGRDWAQSLFFARMAELTGVSFTFQQFTEEAAYPKAKADILGGELLPDVLFKAGLTPQEELRYAESGVLIDLAPLLRENAPNLWALLEAHPDWREAVTLPDGKIVALPALADPADQVCVWLNKGWLDALHLEEPDSPESFRAALTAFRDGDPNGNGKKDEIPLYLMGPWEAKWLMSFFGLAANDYNVYLDEAGKVRYAPFQPQFSEFLTYLRDLNAEGLLGKEAFRGSHSLQEQMEQEASTLRVGGMISFVPSSLLDVKFVDQFIALTPLEYGGRAVYRDLLGPVWRGAFAVTRACPDPAAALRWVDALYAEPGATLAMAGQEGIDYSYNEQGRWIFMVDEMRGIDSLRADALMDATGEAVPGIRPAGFIENFDYDLQTHLTTQTAKVAQAARLPVPLRYLAEDVQAEIDELQLKLGEMVDTGIAKFATGETPLDAEHLASFEQELRDAGAERLVELWQSVEDARK